MCRPVGEHVWFENYPKERMCTKTMRQPPPYDPSKHFPHCFSFARKFNGRTTEVVQRILETMYIT